MKKSNDTATFADELARQLDDIGMGVLGSFEPTPDELPVGLKTRTPMSGVMIFSTHEMWHHFKASVQYDDGEPDPLERWSGEVLGNVAARFDAGLVLPFERPYAPFQTWATRASGIRQSPLGLLIHPQHGLWFALRGVLLLEVKVKNQLLQKLNQVQHPCEACIDKPCLSACPVGAFDDVGFDVVACRSHISSGVLPDCMEQGCGARAACPVGVRHKYCDEQVRFHMVGFRGGTQEID